MSSDTVMARFMNTGRAAQGVYACGVRVYIQPGQIQDVEMSQTEWSGWSDKETVKAHLASKEEKSQDTPDTSSQPSSGDQMVEYISKHRGGGSYSVMDGDTEVVPGLDKEASLAFNALDPEEQQDWVTARLEEVNR